jgi:hypothetical protein
LSNCVNPASQGYLTDSIFDVNDSKCVEVVAKINCYILTLYDAENGALNVKDIS